MPPPPGNIDPRFGEGTPIDWSTFRFKETHLPRHVTDDSPFNRSFWDLSHDEESFDPPTVGDWDDSEPFFGSPDVGPALVRAENQFMRYLHSHPLVKGGTEAHPRDLGPSNHAELRKRLREFGAKLEQVLLANPSLKKLNRFERWVKWMTGTALDQISEDEKYDDLVSAFLGTVDLIEKAVEFLGLFGISTGEFVSATITGILSALGLGGTEAAGWISAMSALAAAELAELLELLEYVLFAALLAELLVVTGFAIVEFVRWVRSVIASYLAKLKPELQKAISDFLNFMLDPNGTLPH